MGLRLCFKDDYFFKSSCLELEQKLRQGQKRQRERGCHFDPGRGCLFKHQSLPFQKGLKPCPLPPGMMEPGHQPVTCLLPVCPSSGDRCWPEGAAVTPERSCSCPSSTPLEEEDRRRRRERSGEGWDKGERSCA